jgi:lysophospholipase L1-like esterase
LPPRLILAFFGALLCLPSAGGDLQGFAQRCLQAKATPVRILQFGDSHLALPGVQRLFRGVFQAQCGDGGPGFGLPWVRPQTGLRAQVSSGWHRPSRQMPGAVAGLQDTWLEAVRTGEAASVEGAFSHVRIHFQGLPGGGSAKILVDGRLLEEVALQADPPELKVFERSLPGSRRLEVVTTGSGPVRLLGLSLEEPAGAVHSVMAFNGLQASWLLTIPESLFAAQVKAEAPDLVILAFGTNEANDRLFDAELYRRDLESLMTRFELAAPAAALVLVGPPDARLPRSLPGALEAVIEVQRAVSAHHGAYFWDQRAAMGGAGSIAAWNQSGLANRDLVHFTQAGYQRLAKAFLDPFFQRLAQLAGPEGAFQVAWKPEAAPARPDHPIYVFRTRDGRTIITDDPANVAGEQGAWEGRPPE